MSTLALIYTEVATHRFNRYSTTRRFFPDFTPWPAGKPALHHTETMLSQTEIRLCKRAALTAKWTISSSSTSAISRAVEVFGWLFTDYGPTYTEFSDGRITGGFTSTEAVTPGGGPLVVFHAANLQETRDKLQAAGAEIVQPIFAFPGGQRFHFKNLDGYILGVWTEN